MALTQEQANLFASFEVRRAREIEPSVLRAMKGPMVNGTEDHNIIDLFVSNKYLQDDLNGHLASFVVLAPNGLPMLFFSLRCGELFERVNPAKILSGCRFFDEIKSCMNNPQLSEEQKRNEIMLIANRMQREGLTIDDVMELTSKQQSIKADEELEVDKDLNRVSEVHPAIEIKFLGKNTVADSYWKSLGLPVDKKMGETLFWTKVVDTIDQMMSMVGCEYVYLFAADNEADGELVQYYRVRLNFDSNLKVSANKPHFDFQSQFLFQSVKDLFSAQKTFMENF